jgi:hypothetical protein
MEWIASVPRFAPAGKWILCQEVDTGGFEIGALWVGKSEKRKA